MCINFPLQGRISNNLHLAIDEPPGISVGRICAKILWPRFRRSRDLPWCLFLQSRAKIRRLERNFTQAVISIGETYFLQLGHSVFLWRALTTSIEAHQKQSLQIAKCHRGPFWGGLGDIDNESN